MKKVLILSQSIIKSDARVLKHIHFLSKAGFTVYPVGLEKVEEYRNPGIFVKLYRIVRRFLFKKSAYDEMTANFHPDIPEIAYDIVIANDFNTLPIAIDCCRKYNAKLVYDTHEHATRQFDGTFKWRILKKPVIKAIEKEFIPYATLVTTVCEPIAQEMLKIYGVKALVVRNIPNISAPLPDTKRTPSYPIKLYHHGGYVPWRRLDIFCAAMEHFEGKYELHLRLVGNCSELKNRFSNYRNIIFHEPVDADQILNHMSEFDIGIHMLPPTSYNHRIALPNKFFDYLLGGLPVITANTDESMSVIVEQHDIGFLASEFSVEAIVDVLKSITIENIIEKKKNLINIRGKFNAEREWTPLVNAIKKMTGEII